MFLGPLFFRPEPRRSPPEAPSCAGTAPLFPLSNDSSILSGDNLGSYFGTRFRERQSAANQSFGFAAPAANVKRLCYCCSSGSTLVPLSAQAAQSVARRAGGTALAAAMSASSAAGLSCDKNPQLANGGALPDAVLSAPLWAGPYEEPARGDSRARSG